MAVEQTKCERIVDRFQKGELPVNFNWGEDKIPGYYPSSKMPTKPDPNIVYQRHDHLLVCEALRDGLGGATIMPDFESMLQYVETAIGFGINTMTVGIYNGKEEGANVMNKLTMGVLGELATNYPQITPIVLSLAKEESLEWAYRCKDINPKTTALVFMGTAPWRLAVMDWSKEYVTEALSNSIRSASDHGMKVIGGSEHTTQTPPDFWKAIIEAQIGSGANEICIADTVGIVTPEGAYEIVEYTKQVLKEMKRPEVIVHWHGHRDTDMDVANAMMAIAAGADRIHVVPRGAGERAGNTRLEAVVMDLSDLMQSAGFTPNWNLSKLSGLLAIFEQLIDYSADNYGAYGKNAFSTSFGIHADAVEKCEKLADIAHERRDYKLEELLRGMARTIYCPIDPKDHGRDLIIRVGSNSGRSNVRLAARRLGLKHLLTDGKIDSILSIAKGRNTELTDQELINLLNA